MPLLSIIFISQLFTPIFNCYIVFKMCLKTVHCSFFSSAVSHHHHPKFSRAVMNYVSDAKEKEEKEEEEIDEDEGETACLCVHVHMLTHQGNAAQAQIVLVLVNIVSDGVEGKTGDWARKRGKGENTSLRKHYSWERCRRRRDWKSKQSSAVKHTMVGVCANGKQTLPRRPAKRKTAFFSIFYSTDKWRELQTESE